MAVVESRIREVTVFYAGALIAREAVVEAEAGRLPATVELPFLPLALFDPTVRVRVEHVDGEGEVWASQIAVGLFARPPESAPSPPADEERRRARRNLDRLARALARLEHEVALLSSIDVPSRPAGEEGKPPPPSPMAARVALLELSDEGVQRRVTELRRLREERRRAAEELAAIEDALARVSTARKVKAEELTKVVVAHLSQGPETVERARIVVEYLVPGARWAPAYQCHLAEDGTQADIKMRALVSQCSGEDWRGARLRLSTASPMRYSELPELSALKIGRAQAAPPPRRGFRPPPRGALALFSDHDRDLHAARQALPSSRGWRPPTLALHPLPPAALTVAEAGGRAPRSPRPRARVLAAPPPAPAAPPPGSGRPGPITQAAMAPIADDRVSSDLEVAAALDDGALEGGAYEEDLVADFDESTPPYEDLSRGAPSSESTMEVRALRKALGRKGPGAAVIEVAAFTSLQLGPATDLAERGRLTPISRRETYLRTLLRAGLEVTIDVMSVVDEASKRAGQTLSMPLPPDTADVHRASGSFDFVYETEHAVDVDSDLAWHSIPVGTRSAEADVRYVVVPREDPSVYRVVTLENPLDGPLLPGPAEIYVGGEYVLSTQLPTVAPRGEVRLGLGVEQAIKCARNARFSEERSGETRVAMTELSHVIEIELVNHTRRPARIEVRERIPQPAPEAEVVVDEQGVDPPWQPFTQEEQGQAIEGGRMWSVALDAGGSRKLRAGYVVRLYANNELVGGNRREA